VSRRHPSNIWRIDHECCTKPSSSSIELSHMITQAYLGDFTDADLLVRSVPGSNHAAWQLGHTIAACEACSWDWASGARASCRL